MSFFVVLACFAIQWFLGVTGAQYEWSWAGKYTQWMSKHFQSLEKGHGIFTLIIMILPIIIVASLVFTIAYHLLGHIGYLILSLLLLWYYTDIIFLKQANTAATAAELLLKAYQKIFAPLFWYFVFGPIGLVLYVAVVTLRSQMNEQHYFMLAQSVLDWVPIRLVGLTFALAGNFGVVFKVWMQELFRPLSDNNQNQVVLFGEAAISADSDATSLLHRTVFIWLVIMLLITLGSWFG